LPVLEAMACGTPVITSTTSSLPEVAGDAALKVDPLDVDGLALAMRRIVEDDALRATLSSAGLARAAEFSWQRTAQRTLDIYTSIS
jgi:glycosyltransferase involved in cell wall biosynthesis